MNNNDQIKKNRKAEKNQAKRLAIIKAEERVFTRNGFYETPIAEVAKEILKGRFSHESG
jgi:AcrR family transcriptional regulator